MVVLVKTSLNNKRDAYVHHQPQPHLFRAIGTFAQLIFKRVG